MNDAELHHYSNCTDSNRLNFVGFRNELAMLSVTNQLIQSRIFAMNSVQLNRDHPTWWQKYALMYRDGQEKLYKNTLDIIQNHKFRVLNAMKLSLDNNNLPTTAPFIDALNNGYFGLLLENRNTTSSFVPLESVTLTLKRLLGKDQEFKDTIDQLFEDIEEEEDVVFMLALIRESTKGDSVWQPFIRKTQQDSALQRDSEAVVDLRGLYDSLFPAFSDTFPDIFDPEIYTFENLLWAENIMTNYTIDNPLVVVPL
ncbi:hypothetical protein BCR42DRAFT_317551 [Absidia repens]|uniref:Uncharacterized protein n=1 Tax=Absidia repens TaxID=90262 RepID=A0A1X2IZK7_9FUNG|nr:hypothetical protein BCR42DRAFT_317551 [Absidia repens]